MPRDPQSRASDENAQPKNQERPAGLAPEEVAGPDRKQNAAEPDWLSMATADPALFLKNPDAE